MQTSPTFASTFQLVRRAAAAAMTAAVATTACIGGALLIAAPDGHLLGLDAALLRQTPFPSFLVPGLLLLGVVAGSAGAALVALLRGSRHAPAFTIAAGVALVFWMAGQFVLLGHVHPLQPAMLVTGVMLELLGLFERLRQPAA